MYAIGDNYLKINGIDDSQFLAPIEKNYENTHVKYTLHNWKCSSFLKEVGVQVPKPTNNLRSESILINYCKVS